MIEIDKNINKAIKIYNKNNKIDIRCDFCLKKAIVNYNHNYLCVKCAEEELIEITNKEIKFLINEVENNVSK